MPETPKRLRAGELWTVAAAWLLFRMLFFEGLWGYDDLVHVRFALDPGIPSNVFEGRLLFNGLLIAAVRLFGFAEWALALPTLVGSAAFVAASYQAGRRFLGQGFMVGLLAAALPLDVIFSTAPMSTALANGLVAWGGYLMFVDRSRRSGIGAAVLLALGMSCHLVFALFVLPLMLVGAWWRSAGVVEGCGKLGEVYGAPRLRRFAVLGLQLFGWISLSLLSWDVLAFWIVSGDPWLHLELLRTTHLEDQVYIVPRFLSDGRANPGWWLWPLAHGLMSKHFGLMLSVPAGLGLLRWRRLSSQARAMLLVLLGGWLYLSYGSQHPFGYAPIDRQERYWYGLAMPACLLAGAVVSSFSSRWGRGVLWTILLLPSPLLLLASGSWGQNMETSRSFLELVESRPKDAFVTDGNTFKEMGLWSQLSPPQNLQILEGAGVPPWPPRPVRLRSDMVGATLLFSPLNASRLAGTDYRAWVTRHCRLAVSEEAVENRLLQWVPALRGRLPERRPAAQVGSCRVEEGFLRGGLTPDGSLGI